jgi:hypothetical protein
MPRRKQWSGCCCRSQCRKARCCASPPAAWGPFCRSTLRLSLPFRFGRLIVDASPDAARIPCDLGILQTFVPDECLAVELHGNRLSEMGAQPRWRRQSGVGRRGPDPALRPVFAYNPIEPHRFGKARIARFELQIQFNATVLRTKPGRSGHGQPKCVDLDLFALRAGIRLSNLLEQCQTDCPTIGGAVFPALERSGRYVAVQQANDDCLAVQQRSDETNDKDAVDARDGYVETTPTKTK